MEYENIVLTDSLSSYANLPLIFIAAGLVLLSAVSYLARLFRRHRRSLSALLKLAQSNLDPLQLPAAAWPALAGGGIRKLEYSGVWFGQAVRDSFGAALDHDSPHPFTFSIVADGDIRLDFRLCPNASRGETHLLAEHLSGVFRLLLETAVHSQMEALSATLAEQARLTLYVQHDLRNLAQWVEWLAEDFSTAGDDATLLHLGHLLSTSAPHAAARARRILDTTCKLHTSIHPAPQPVALNDAINHAAEHAGITITLNPDDSQQDTRVFLRRHLLDRTLDNLFTHVAPLLRQHPELSVSVTLTQQADRVLAKILMPHLAEVEPRSPERLFEPFASGRPGGLGLGLYQARKSLHEAGGELLAEMQGRNICFLLNMPGTGSAPQV